LRCPAQLADPHKQQQQLRKKRKETDNEDKVDSYSIADHFVRTDFLACFPALFPRLGGKYFCCKVLRDGDVKTPQIVCPDE
jgi:hypothetical protein